MSFYTSLSFYRPTKPPAVTGAVLGEFVRALSATSIFERRGAEYFNVKFGRAIDQDMLSTLIAVPDPKYPLISTTRSIDWDIAHDNLALDDALKLLVTDNRSVYRATINLGSLRADIHKALQTAQPDGERMNLDLWDCTLSLAPVELATFDGEERFMVGWMEVSLSGNGYLWPWTPRDLTSRAGALDALRPMTGICRHFFPVDESQRKAKPQDVGDRRQMGELWPFEDLARDWDWFWGVQETG